MGIFTSIIREHISCDYNIVSSKRLFQWLKPTISRLYKLSVRLSMECTSKSSRKTKKFTLVENLKSTHSLFIFHVSHELPDNPTILSFYQLRHWWSVCAPSSCAQLTGSQNGTGLSSDLQVKRGWMDEGSSGNQRTVMISLAIAPSQERTGRRNKEAKSSEGRMHLGLYLRVSGKVLVFN